MHVDLQFREAHTHRACTIVDRRVVIARPSRRGGGGREALFKSRIKGEERSKKAVFFMANCSVVRVTTVVYARHDKCGNLCPVIRDGIEKGGS